MATTTSYEIHPAIGIVRLGPSHECFLAPEPACTQKDYDQPKMITDPAKLKRQQAREIDGVKPLRNYRDKLGQLKRQAVRFRVFKVVRDVRTGRITSCKEMQGNGVTIDWTVHLVNRKAVAPRFVDDRGDVEKVNVDVKFLRNPDVKHENERERLLVIDSQPQSPKGHTVATARRLHGKFMDKIPVTLGHAWTDNRGRLLVAGGFGISESVTDDVLTEDNFADNDGWYDDTSDGVVSAMIKVGNGPKMRVESAHVVVAPFDFAPEVNSFVTLYDVAFQAAVERKWSARLSAIKKTDFTLHVLPILERTRGYRWVNSPVMRADVREKHAAWKPGIAPDTLFALLGDPTIVPKNSGTNPPPDRDILINRAISLRKMFLRHLRNPADKAETREVKMPRLHDDDDNDNAVLPLTPVQYRHMVNWARGKGHFTNAPKYGEFLCEAVDRIALEACSGGPFYPGMEVPRIVKNKHKYIAPFRLDPVKVKSGHLTQGLAVPWQADFFACQMDGDNGWWPATRPDKVIVLQKGEALGLKVMSDVMSERMEEWDNNVADMNEMVDKWHQLGIVRRVTVDPAPRIADRKPGSDTAGFLYIEGERTLDRERGRSLKP